MRLGVLARVVSAHWETCQAHLLRASGDIPDPKAHRVRRRHLLPAVWNRRHARPPQLAQAREVRSSRRLHGWRLAADRQHERRAGRSPAQRDLVGHRPHAMKPPMVRDAVQVVGEGAGRYGRRCWGPAKARLGDLQEARFMSRHLLAKRSPDGKSRKYDRKAEPARFRKLRL